MIRSRTLCLVMAGLLLPTVAPANVTPFGERVNSAIERGLGYLRSVQQNGRMGEGSGGGPTGLAALCFLEKRTSADWNAPAVGYEGMDPADQELVRNSIRFCINEVPGFNGNTPYSYTTGSCLMALSLYLVTNGPDNVGARVSVTQAIQSGVGALQATQGRQGQNQGGWNYQGPSNDGDLSTTQFAMAGLAAAASIVPQADDNLAATAEFVSNARNGDNGHKYRGGGNYPSTSAMSASGAWTYRLSGLPTEEGRVQGTLGWLAQNYRYDSIITINNWLSQYYYMWAAAKAFEVTADNGRGAPLYSDNIGGVRDTAGDGFPEEAPHWYYDFAWFLTDRQTGNGGWGSNPGAWNGVSATAYSILVLERSLGGVCIGDDDEDGWCDTSEDNCPNTPNPDQADRDGDGVGDLCDSCIDEPNRDQIDADGDDIGDACDPLICIPDGMPDMCDGLDNDCDGQVDEGPDGGVPVAPGPCATGEPGICAVGQRACVDGAIVCIPDVSPEAEICDFLDNNCDGFIDEGLVNACGDCNVDPEEICDGIDNNCDGFIDEGDLCDRGWVCLEGECRRPCSGNECPDAGTYCHPELNLCLEPCVGVECDWGMLCNETTNQCEDPCFEVGCLAELRCWMGECVDNTCVAPGCPEGSICNGIECVPDACTAAECSQTEFCRDGQCIPSCARISCPLYQICVDGMCVDDDCTGLECDVGEICSGAGECGPDLCLNADCGANETCEQGECVFNGCTTVECPPGQVCEVIHGAPQCLSGFVAEPPAPPVVNPDNDGGIVGQSDGGHVGPPQVPDGGVGPPPVGGGDAGEEDGTAGCACDVAGRSASPLLLALLLPFVLNRARRRRRAARSASRGAQPNPRD